MTMFGIKASGRVIATDLEQENAGCCTLMTNPLAILTVRISVCSRSRFAPVAAEVSPRHHSVKTTQRPVAALSKGVTVSLTSMVQRVKPKTMDAFSFQLIYHLFSFCSFQVSLSEGPRFEQHLLEGRCLYQTEVPLDDLLPQAARGRGPVYQFPLELSLQRLTTVFCSSLRIFCCKHISFLFPLSSHCDSPFLHGLALMIGKCKVTRIF
ncbi:hypothetical protein BLNAU_15291 [Blattamonas nauphoetae]|uniref:Uncharacterized protein n=1 Tax=Blattamonas nauphoetae TaxID=2049346 RepID=A0ABQ9XB07_9EUKA|nr:hypothetical protein BLNAU_15291 [Blattamonas nauphoetae]